ncbi:hypothetical protein B0J15DRAFT_503008 [Fusarium solani]|uniref:Uncharacterized protein n=1 Tax=Fusarium solani TaxID=169388 RepID=A0A9P9GE25_FUSSL|nr:uncharacterized protein B0J15DRAFT_503008 [Fusarium solani]KAH7237843.1 hypothetical protein B0J15DRAFT_503008 [Fusarium solani]
MVNTRCGRRRIVTQSRERLSRRTRKSVLLQPSLRSDRQLRSSTIPNLPSPLTLGCEETRLLLETLNVHQAIFPLPISPKDDVKNLEQLGPLKYISMLVVAVENSLDSSSRHTLTRQQRVKSIQNRCGLIECPQHERPDLTDSQALDVLQHDGSLGADYESLIADYENRSPDGPPPIGASIFTSRAFGGLYHKLPPDVSYEEPCLPLLISVYREHHRRLEYCCKWETQSLLHTYDSIRSRNSDQVSALGVQALHAPACVPQL